MKTGVQPIRCRYCRKPIPADVEPVVRENRPYCSKEHADADARETAKLSRMYPTGGNPELFR